MKVLAIVSGALYFSVCLTLCITYGMIVTLLKINDRPIEPRNFSALRKECLP